MYALGRLYHKMNEKQKAIEALETAFQIISANEYKEYRLGQVCTALGDIYSENGDYAKAIRYYD